MDVTTDVVQCGRDCLLGQLLDQSEQFIALHAHGSSVRIVGACDRYQQRASFRARWDGPSRRYPTS
jgi:hypothetical protein